MDAFYESAPPWHVAQWFNTETDLSLSMLRGKVIVLYAFQMLCPGCVRYSLPQAQQVFEQFWTRDVSVIGLHTVFEHHEVMTPAVLKAFIHENNLRFPIGVDHASSRSPIPLTMAGYEIPGTPTFVLIDRNGNIRQKHFGHLSDLNVGMAVATLVAEARDDGRRRAAHASVTPYIEKHAQPEM